MQVGLYVVLGFKVTFYFNGSKRKYFMNVLLPYLGDPIFELSLGNKFLTPIFHFELWCCHELELQLELWLVV